MGTLTGDMPQLAEHCPHKLATSCRLTSTPNCCACADERHHSSSYSVYIDGVGFVQRGTRWQSYCWFCKEFWNNRIASTDPPLALSQTRIPELPDQSEFLDRWNEFHQGYRIVKAADGTESRIAVVGEPFRDVSPGYLPLTLNELRTGQQNDETRALNRTTRATTSTEAASTTESQRTIEEELERLLEDEEDVDIPSAQPQRSLEIQQLRERRAEWTAERTRRVWGTREDIESDDYMSPITGLFNRHLEWNRRRMEARRVEEEQRRLEAAHREADRATATSLPNPPTSPHPNASSVTPNEPTRRQPSTPDILESFASYAAEQYAANSLPSGNENLVPQEPLQLRTEQRRQLEQLQQLQQLHNEQQERFFYQMVNADAGTEEAVRRLTALRSALEHEHNGTSKHLDNDSRPEPKTDAEKMVKLECQICYQQVANMACVPCGHLVMCEWCADIQMPVKHRNVPETRAKCPMCRKKVTQRIKIHIG
ncbi:uncharacterized protein BDZ99DRAFT_502774 [Mytilinidion resinicola]|uniref:RING-type domain-containing protein n=1 Tax=Mytilinidion resinicola TaxID=574789 RepID=A0A6A6Y564_9PEZI|nr:uncharacterized protein BDZ99DRAFT_502774 [Mytilinidion resinicola]KAF2803932.1 hypothetical protein BDZ99DRAFT_502774 [Mytilinidion resinicola]